MKPYLDLLLALAAFAVIIFLLIVPESGAPAPTHAPAVASQRPTATPAVSVPEPTYTQAVGTPLIGTPEPTLGPRAYASSLLTARRYDCLDAIVMRESRWEVDAENPSSGAYGIPQALPPEKMASAGEDWRTNAQVQIDWMLQYLNGRYGGPCRGWAFWQVNGWY